MTDTTRQNLFEQLGGEDAVAAVFDVFHDKVLGGPGLESCFAGVDLDGLKQRKRRFIGQAPGSTRPYTGRCMRKAHERPAITDAAFGRVVTRLGDSPAEAGVDTETIGAIAAALTPLRQDIVTV
ncbi:group 1 truncated hemoglobin [Streptomyces sp. NPDC020996]|uniref:group I truncated hemoglobin n=1 Tax=Streptomyces sp. NPDC020996 TaxID=3154791 RepID=UPI0033D8B329